MLEFMEKVGQFKKESKMSKEDMLRLAEVFYNDMEAKTALKMLPAYIYTNTPIKPGQYVALDFGGSNARAMLYDISENGTIELLNSRVIKLRGSTYDFTIAEFELSEVLAVIVSIIEEIIDPDKSYLLGHTFSFPIEITGRNESVIVEMSKGFELRNAAGQDVNKILKAELDKAEVDVVPVSILNDTTATLLAGRALNYDTDIACIVGTGHNICFIDTDNQIVNTECGFLDIGIPLTSYDEKYLQMIPNERNAVMEALVGGKNSGKIAENYAKILEEEYGKGCIKLNQIIPRLLSMALEDKYDEDFRGGLEERVFLNNIACIIFDRAAQLVVSEIVGILKRIDPDLSGQHNIVFDGSVYEKTPYFRKCITKYIRMMYPEKYKMITHSLMKDGSSLGAAISAAM